MSAEQILLAAGVFAPAAFKRSFMSAWFVETRLVGLFNCALCLGFWTTLVAVLATGWLDARILIAIPGAVAAYVIDKIVALLESSQELVELKHSKLLNGKD